jgi:hypothetical protein
MQAPTPSQDKTTQYVTLNPEPQTLDQKPLQGNGGPELTSVRDGYSHLVTFLFNSKPETRHPTPERQPEGLGTGARVLSRW